MQFTFTQCMLTQGFMPAAFSENEAGRPHFSPKKISDLRRSAAKMKNKNC